MTLITRPGYLWSDDIWNPTMVANLGGWYDASKSSSVYDATTGGNLAATGNTIARLEDRSFNARNLVQATAGSRPTYTANGLNGLNTLAFDGGDFLSGPSIAIPQPITIISVVRYDAQTSFDRASVLTGNSSVGSVLNFDGSFNFFSIPGSTFPTSAWRLFEVVFNGVDSYIRYSGGTSLTGLSFNSTASLQGLNMFGYEGREPAGSMAESVIYSSVLSNVDRQKLEGYFSYKWGLEANLPNDHPYKTTGPTP